MRLHGLLGLLFLTLAASCRAAPLEIVGAWLLETDELKVRFEAKDDGSFTQTVRTAEGAETYRGTYRMEDDVLTLTTEDGDVMRLRVERAGDDAIRVTDEAGNVVEFAREAREGPAPLEPNGEEPAPLPPAAGPGDLVPQTALEPTQEGHIVFTRLVPLQLQGGGINAVAPTPKLFVMAGDGSGQQPFLLGEPATSLKEPRWSGDYTRLAFTSDFRPERSALLSDLFVCATDGTPAMRITGNELKGPAPRGYGMILGIVVDNASAIVAGEEQTLAGIHITAQGALGIVHPGVAPPGATQEIIEALRDQPRAFVIPHVAAGNSVWVKIWVNSNVGRVFTCPVEANQVTDLGKVSINEATFSAGKPSLTPDGRFVVGMSVVNSVDQGTLGKTGGLGRTGGSSSVTLYDIATGSPAAQVSPEQIGATSLVGAVVSPDGRSIACGAGQPTMENLVLLDTADVLAGTPRFRPVVAGERLLPSPQTMGRAWLVGCGSIAWSPDSRSLAFCRSWMSEDVTGDLWLVNADGSGLTQITRVAPNQMAINPSFSPDGRRLAFTLITGKPTGLKVEDLMRRQYTSDIYSIGLDGSAPRQLTTDGLSCEPAWGP